MAAALGIWMIYMHIDGVNNGVVLVQPTAVWTMLVMGVIFLPLSVVIALMAWSAKFENLVNRGLQRLINPPPPRPKRPKRPRRKRR